MPNHTESLSLFLEFAESEHDLISSLCNTSALLSRSVDDMADAQDDSVVAAHDACYPSSPGSFSANPPSEFDERRIRRSVAHGHVLDYHAGRDGLSKIHEEMKCLANSASMDASRNVMRGRRSLSSDWDDRGDVPDFWLGASAAEMAHMEGTTTIRMMQDHVGLATRVIRTCLGVGGLGGVPTSTGDAFGIHECRIVALASLNASISDLNRWQKQLQKKAENVAER